MSPFGTYQTVPSTARILVTRRLRSSTTPTVPFAINRLNAAECLVAERDAGRLSDGVRAVLPRAVDRPARTGPSTPPRPAPPCTPTSGSPRWPASASATTSRVCRRRGACSCTCRRRSRRAWPTSAGCGRTAPDRYLLLDEVTRRSLELTRTLRDGSREGSLLACLDRTVTPMGARLLHDWLLAPLTDRPAIDARLDAVAELLDDHRAARATCASCSTQASDLQRLTARVSTGRASPRDLAAVARTLRLLPQLKAKLDRPAVGAAARPRRPARALPRPARAARRRPGRRPAADAARRAA